MYDKKMLKKVSLFADLSDGELEALGTVAEGKTFQAGEVIYSEDKGGGSLFIIVRGLVRITKMVRFEERQTLSRLHEGEFFGEMSFIDGHQHSATAEAAEETEVIEITGARFEQLAETNARLAYRVTLKLALQISTLLRKMDERFVEMVNYMWGKGKV